MKKVNLRRSSILAILYALAMTAPLNATDKGAPTAIEDARAILVASQGDQVMDAMITQLVPVMESGFIGQLAQIEQGDFLLKQIEGAYPGGTQGFGKRFGELFIVKFKAEYPSIMEKAAQQYVSQISPADLASIRAFMESPAGRNMVEAQPQIQQQMSAAGQAIGRKAGEEAAAALMVEARKFFGKKD